MRLILLVIALVFSQFTFASQLSVAVILPDDEDNPFWKLVADVGQSAADSLDIELELMNHAGDRFSSKTLVDELTQRKNKPDYLVFFPFLGDAAVVFAQLETAKIKFVSLEQTFGQDVGKPQEKYKHWLGQINYDNKAAGELLLNALLASHVSTYGNTPMHITGIGGNYEDVAMSRQWVFKKYALEHDNKDLVFNQVFHMNWDTSLVQERFLPMRERYPLSNIYWCASDIMALEILNQHIKNTLPPSTIGGFDWQAPALKKIKTGELAASVGGHFLMVGDALVKIADYHKGIDRFVTSAVLNSYELITRDNVNEYLPYLEGKKWRQSDFSKYLTTQDEQAPRHLSIANLIADSRP
jgi:ABC-type sugar transport system substrate-binding protein